MLPVQQAVVCGAFLCLTENVAVALYPGVTFGLGVCLADADLHIRCQTGSAHPPPQGEAASQTTGVGQAAGKALQGMAAVLPELG